MATYPLPPGRRQINLEMPSHMVEHLDARARELSTTTGRCSRAAYVRWLVERDMQGVRAAATAA
jgi:predicted DNA-binding protein